jgi:hypothetical protein
MSSSVVQVDLFWLAFEAWNHHILCGERTGRASKQNLDYLMQDEAEADSNANADNNIDANTDGLG